MPIGCILLDREFLVSFWNRACETIFGFTREEMTGRSLRPAIVPPEEPEGPQEMLAALGETPPLPAVHRNLTRDGRLIHCEWHNTVIRNAAGGVDHFICLTRDVTDRIRSREALKNSEQVQQQLNSHLARTREAMAEALAARIESEAELLKNKLELNSVNSQLKGILDAVEEGLILYSRELDILWSNRGAEKYFPAPSPAEEGVPLTLAQAASGSIRDCFDKATPLSDQIASAGGQILDIRLYPIPGEGGEVQSVLEVVRDVTAKTNQQAEALRTAHLASLGELAAGVAHEINNPTHGIINYAELLIREFPDEERIRDVSARIVKESERIARIVRSLLDFARKRDGGKLRVRLEEAVEEALTLCRSQLKRDGIQVQFERENLQPLEVLADSQQVVQVLLNLIANARYSLNDKFAYPDPEKRIDCRLARVTRDGDTFARLTVTDRGGGIPERLLSKVLNPFFTTKPHGRGTGLGLSICNTIVADHGGMLEIASREGTETAVTILFPIWRDHAA